MEKFKKKLRRIGGWGTANVIAMFAIAAALALTGYFFNSTEEYAPFDPMNDGYATMEVLYVMGPFAEKTDGTRTSGAYYVAETAEHMWYVLGTKPKDDLPIYRETAFDEDGNAPKPQTVYGKSKELSKPLVKYLVEFFAGAGFGISETNYTEFFGTHYLDSTVTAVHDWDSFYYLAILLALFGQIPFFFNHNQRSRVKRRIAEMEESGELAQLYQDFLSGEPIYSTRLKLALSHRYLLDFSVTEEGFRLIRLSDIDNVFHCNIIDGQPTSFHYIALESENGRYCVAKWRAQSKQFKQVLARLKADVAEERTLGWS